ncbi:MAG: ATP phosphoribosyltransferase [Solirubrobacteraceae bacterium]|nr:ATP phosphoribosyltransferase [Solirubrobacteraceae bacterium]
MSALGGLSFAVPRGAMFSDTLDILDALGVDTTVIRENDRRLYFPELGIITMRPSDVPIYVESGAAALGITGKDVLLEQPGRRVLELADLKYAGARMILATLDGVDPTIEQQRRLGRVRVATKYIHTATEYFQATGRQAEIVEVKGSVELAPLTGMVEAIVDLTATGNTLKANGLVEREEIFVTTARLIANPVASSLSAQVVDDVARRLRELADRA